MKRHIGIDVEGMLIYLSNSPIPPTAQLKKMVTELQDLQKQGVKVYSYCPTPVEVETGVWECPGHPS